MKQLASRAADVHAYDWAAADEQKILYQHLHQTRDDNHLDYKKRFVQGANARRPAYLQFSHPASLKKNPSLRAMFHQGLLKDEAGTYWIVKKFNPRAKEDRQPREPRNSPRYERLAYLLAKTRANYAEIRFLQAQELKHAGAIRGDWANYYLTRVATPVNLDVSAAPHMNPAEAFNAILVANIFMRKWDQHLDNFAYAGATPLAIDHDMIGPPLTFPHSPAGNSSFSLAFLSFKLVATVSHLRPLHPVDLKAKERLRHHFVRQNHREAWMIMQDIVHGLGLGAGLIQAEGLQPALLRRNIQAFKALAAIDRCAELAGFEGEERERIVAYLSESQRGLGGDVNAIWTRLSGENARLDQPD